jgi:hypothetical protein
VFLVYGNERQTTKLKKKLEVLDGRTDWTSPWELNDDRSSGSVTTLAPRHCGLAMPFCAVVATAALIGSTLKAETPAAGTQEDAPNTHNMLVVGTEAVFLSHLPMFDGLNEGKSDYTSPHRYQVILEARFSLGGKDLTAVYSEDRKNHPKTKMYTLSPTAEFVLAKLFTPDAQKPELSSFRATVFRGHLERRGKPINGLKDIVVTVKQVITCAKVRARGRQTRGAYIFPFRQRHGTFSRPFDHQAAGL